MSIKEQTRVFPKTNERSPSFSVSRSYTKAWMETVRLSSYLAIILYAATLLGPYTSVRCVGPTVVPYSDINKTIRDQFFRHMFLTELKNKIESDGALRNISAHNGRATSTPLSPDKVYTTGISQNFTFLSNKPVLEKGATPMLGISPPNLVYSEVEEKNVLSFKFKPKIVRGKTQAANIFNLFLYLWTKESKGKVPPSPALSASISSPSPTTRDLKNDEQRDRRKGKTIKIRVFLSNVNGSRGQRLAELKTTLETSHWGRISLPVTLVSTLVESDRNNTLRLRIECIRCSRKTQVILPGNTDPKRCRQRQGAKKNKDGKKYRWKKHCVKAGNTDKRLFPFIVIEEKSKYSQERPKRALDITSCESRAACKNGTTSQFRTECNFRSQGNLSTREHSCSLVKTHVEFSDLNLNYVIVHPSGFEYATCIRGGGDKLISIYSGADNHIQKIADLISENIRHHGKIYSHNPLKTSFTKNISGHSSAHHQPPQHLLLQQQQKSNLRQLGHHYRWYNHKRSRLKRHGVCEPKETKNLDIVYLTDEHKFAQTQLPGIVVTRCSCKYGSPFAKD